MLLFLCSALRCESIVISITCFLCNVLTQVDSTDFSGLLNLDIKNQSLEPLLLSGTLHSPDRAHGGERLRQPRLYYAPR